MGSMHDFDGNMDFSAFIFENFFAVLHKISQKKKLSSFILPNVPIASRAFCHLRDSFLYFLGDIPTHLVNCLEK